MEMIEDILNQIGTITFTESNIEKNYNPYDDIIPKKFNKLTDYSLCKNCNIRMHLCNNEMLYECEKCGQLIEHLINEETISNSYNTSDSVASPIQISGPNNYMYQKKLVSNISNYRKTQRKTTLTKMTDIIYQFRGNQPPKKIIEEAAELYFSIQQYCIKRGEVLKGTMAACLYRVCDINNITRKPKEIASMFNIQQCELSNGEKIINELESQGLIKIKTQNKKEKIDSFLNRYFESLGIPDKYLEFAKRLIRFTEKYHISDSSIVSSKCAGTIYLIIEKTKNNTNSETQIKTTREDIEKECQISKSTFSRFANNVNDVLNCRDPIKKRMVSRLRHLFKIHNIIKLKH